LLGGLATAAKQKDHQDDAEFCHLECGKLLPLSIFFFWLDQDKQAWIQFRWASYTTFSRTKSRKSAKAVTTMLRTVPAPHSK